MHRAVSTAWKVASQDCHLEEMLAFWNGLSFRRVSAASSETRYSAITLFFHPSPVINLINLDSSEEDNDGDHKNVTGQKGDTSTRRRQLVLGMKSHW